jgi:hypothetical protein
VSADPVLNQRFNAFPDKGLYDFKYGLNAHAITSGKGMKEKSTAIISRAGQSECMPGHKMQNGKCVPMSNDLVCEPGWVKKNGRCVKGPKEFAVADFEREPIFPVEKVRKYFKEMQGTGDKKTFFGRVKSFFRM